MKTQMKLGTIAIGILISTYGFSQSNSGMNKQQKKDKTQIEDRINQFVIDFKSGNGEGFADIFSDTYIPPEQKKAIAGSIKQMFDLYIIEYEININDIKVDVNMAYEEGWYRTTLTPRQQGDEIIEEYDFLDVWEKENGEWRITKALKTKRTTSTPKKPDDTSDDYSAFLGKYEVNGSILEIIKDDENQLALLSPGQPPIVLESTGANQFQLKGVPGATILFETGDGDSYDVLRLKQATGELVANRKK